MAEPRESGGYDWDQFLGRHLAPGGGGEVSGAYKPFPRQEMERGGLERDEAVYKYDYAGPGENERFMEALLGEVYGGGARSGGGSPAAPRAAQPPPPAAPAQGFMGRQMGRLSAPAPDPFGGHWGNFDRAGPASQPPRLPMQQRPLPYGNKPPVPRTIARQPQFAQPAPQQQPAPAMPQSGGFFPGLEALLPQLINQATSGSVELMRGGRR